MSRSPFGTCLPRIPEPTHKAFFESVILSLVTIFLAVAAMWAADSKVAQPMGVKSATMMEMPLVIPLFIQDQDFTSTLVMVNGSNAATAVDVVLTGLDGHEIKSQRVEFTQHSQRQIEIASLLQSAGSSATTGRIVIMPGPNVKNMSVLGQLTMTYVGSREPSYIDEEVAMPSAEGSQILRAVTDKAQGSPLVAITSLSDSLQHVGVECLGGIGAQLTEPVDLPAEETVVIHPCGDQTHPEEGLSTDSEDEKQGLSRPVGIALTSDAMPGSFAAFGLTPHKTDGGKFFSAITFVDPK